MGEQWLEDKVEGKRKEEDDLDCARRKREGGGREKVCLLDELTDCWIR